MPDDWTEADDVIEEVREIRRQIWARFDYDIEKLIAHYIERDKQHTGPRIELSPGGRKGKPGAR